eukprot:2370490-Prymnesium_polylepis.1
MILSWTLPASDASAVTSASLRVAPRPTAPDQKGAHYAPLATIGRTHIFHPLPVYDRFDSNVQTEQFASSCRHNKFHAGGWQMP